MSLSRTPVFAALAVFGLGAIAHAQVAPPSGPLSPFRSIDGSGNNPLRPRWGSAGIPLLRLTTVDYADGRDVPSGGARPSARAVSNAVGSQVTPIDNAAGASSFLWQWGQFLDHDIDLSPEADPHEPFDIQVPTGDAWFDPFGTGTQVIPLSRTTYVHRRGVRQQLNEITAWIDASNVYGSDAVRARELRTLDGTGRLETQPSAVGELLPFNTAGLPNAPTELDPTFFLAGDVRANEQLGLTALHTLFVREHNTLAQLWGVLFPGSSGELRYQLSRMLVAAEMQAITYNEFLPLLLGPNALGPYNGWRPFENPGIANFFSTVAYRVGHTMLPPELLRLDASGAPIPAGHVALRDAFFSPAELVAGGGIEPILRGLAVQKSQEIDALIIDDVRNFLFGPPGSGGFDLFSLNTQRGRDHGLPDYNRARMDYGLAPRANFAQVTSDAGVAAALAGVYGSPGQADAWITGLAEDHVPGALVGPLFRTALADQFRRLRDSDRFWYQRSLTPPIQRWVESQTLGRIIRRNTTIGGELPLDVF